MSVKKIVDGEDIKVLSENDPKKKGAWFKEFFRDLIRNLLGNTSNNGNEVKKLSESTTSLFKDAFSHHQEEPSQPMSSSVAVMVCYC
ncbi:hypothetical protein AVI53_12660 [Piscirickettsia salmonis]|nr:hypothetical protein PSLF89_1043 [Piscirickettsia salmonis LF-89 = ATCC VR-1361]ALY04164.1 hypothetical protein AWE47_02735 [Piscirickettsia salmonis]AMA43723.1 hypothetical protein AWJ11_02720 [Piscirickettsia salmonis]AOS36831.1 hypothetical protein AVM72_15710 [Piscirickettsia salmonis]APS61995.1 hypothetical protein AVI53_12660 [Piscirickettsia salmonis]